MSIIGAVSATPPQAALQAAAQVPRPAPQDNDEATESNAARATEASSQHKVNIKA